MHSSVSGIQTIATTPMGEERIIPSSIRPDGTVRKQIKVRPGFVPQEDRTVFKSSRQVQADSRPKIPGFVSHSTHPMSESTSKSKNQRRNENKKLKKLLNQVQSSPASETIEQSSQGLPIETEATPIEKKIKNLRKKLRQIDDLNEKKAQGVVLLSEQQTKVDSKFLVEQELNELLMKLNVNQVN